MNAITRRSGPYLWGDLMRRTFGFDVLQCPRCGGRLRLVALIEHASTVKGILRHFGLPTDLPEPRPARAPPIASSVPTSTGRTGPEPPMPPSDDSPDTGVFGPPCV